MNFIESIYGEYTRVCVRDDQRNMNNNALIIGAQHSGKTKGVALSNIMQMDTNYVVSDPSGELLKLTGKMLMDNGYSVKVVNPADVLHSNRYNPFQYIRTESDVCKLVECYTNAVTEPGRNTDKFWLDAEKGLLCAIIFYFKNYETPDKQNFVEIAKMIRQAKSDDPKTRRKNALKKRTELDKIFDGTRWRPEQSNLCFKYYEMFKFAPDKTALSILDSLDVNFKLFSDVSGVFASEKDDLKLEEFGDDKNALFIAMPAESSSLSNMLYMQMFDELFHFCELHEGRLHANIRFILDDFVTIGRIPNFMQTINTILNP